MWPYGSLFLASSMVLVHGLEVFGRCRKWTSETFDFTGHQLLQGKVWVLFSSSFFHGSHSHLLRELGLFWLSSPAEKELGSVLFVSLWLLSGAFGCFVSWLALRSFLRTSPDYSEMPRHHVDAVADFSNSRGSSASVYGACACAALVAGAAPAPVPAVWTLRHLLADQMISPPAFPWAVLVLARLLPEFVSPVSTRLRKYPLCSLLVSLLLALASAQLRFGLSVAQALSFWFGVNSLLRLCPSLLALPPVAEYAATDFTGHLVGACYGAMCGMCFLMITGGSWPGGFASPPPLERCR
ncbi:unnamed protein product [Effrenium voratum]|nr:unnamed protein product [Effrenium voratum]